MQPIIDIINELAKNYIDSYFATHPPAYGYFDRGDPIEWDFELGDFVQDDAWHDLDLSSIIPANSACVHFRLVVETNLVNIPFNLRTKGNVKPFNLTRTATVVANIRNSVDVLVAPDSSGFVEYKCLADRFTRLNICVAGWWISGPTLSGFLNRGDPAASDFTENDFPADQVWTDLDLSTILPAATSVVLLRCRVWSGGNQKSLRFRTKNHANAINLSQCEAVQDGLNYYYDIQVPTDGLQTIQYWSSLGLNPVVRMTVKGWWF